MWNSLNPCKKIKYKKKDNENFENIKYFLSVLQHSESQLCHLPFYPCSCPPKTQPLPPNAHFSVLQLVSANWKQSVRMCALVCKGWGSRKGFPDCPQIGPGPSRVARAFYRIVATALTCLSDSCTFPVHILINGCGSRKWNYFKFYKKGLWSLSNSSCYRRGKKSSWIIFT